jgi:oligopeptide/dipeptide ABC transporter ATP-binding protein
MRDAQKRSRRLLKSRSITAPPASWLLEMALLEIRDLKKYFPAPAGVLGQARHYVKAIDGVSFDVEDGETVGLVGESGCGKTSLGRCLVRLSEPTSGTITFEGQELSSLSGRAMREKRRRMQMIFQDPYASLNPRMRIGEIVGEGLRIHGLAKGHDLKLRVLELLTRVGLRKEYYGRYPHEFSGGQRQRIGIARALAVNARFIVADEAVSALDVSIQSQILNMLLDLQQDLGLTYLFISHDLRVVEHVSDRVAVMYLGKIVEVAPAGSLHSVSQHPYTRALLSAVPSADPARRGVRTVLQGDVPSPINPPPGCSFHPRCPFALKRCADEEPRLEFDGKHGVACHVFGPSGKK